ncbi:MAG: hypothetical protein RhofKO_18560 [Rhodothermales bacterium]
MRYLLLFWLGTLLVPQLTIAQGTLSILTRQDNTVYLHHNVALDFGDGFDVYRRVGGGDFVKLNDAPVLSAQTPADATAMFGDDAPAILDLLEQTNTFRAVIDLRSDPTQAALFSLIFPGAARALGRSYVDASAPAGQQVTYRLVFVNNAGTPTGRTLEQTATLTPSVPPAPTSLRAEHTGANVTLYWQAPTGANASDALHFRVYRQGESAPLNARVIVRNDNADELRADFIAATVGVTETYTVRSVDASGQEGPDSAPLAYLVEDNVPPSVVQNVLAYIGGDGTPEVTWLLGPEPDLAGYHVYRARRTGNDDLFERVTDAALDATQTVFQDASVASLESARAWYYKVTSVDESGNESVLSGAAQALVEDQSAPNAPSNLTLTYADGAVQVEWTMANIPDDLQTFIVERKSTDPRAPANRSRANVDDLRTTSFADSGPIGDGFVEGQTYQYWVTAQDSTRNFSAEATALLTIPNITPPEPPTNVRARTHEGRRIDVTWASSPSLDVVAYVVERTAPDGTTEAFAPDGLRLRDDTAQPGIAYTYAVFALDEADNLSNPAATDTVTLLDETPPQTVRNARATRTDAGVVVTWEPVPSRDLAGYRVERADIATGIYTAVTNTLVTDTTWTHTSATSGWYRIIALDTSGNEARASASAEAR